MFFTVRNKRILVSFYGLFTDTHGAVRHQQQHHQTQKQQNANQRHSIRQQGRHLLGYQLHLRLRSDEHMETHGHLDMVT